MSKLLSLSSDRNVELTIGFISLFLMAAFVFLGHLVGYTTYHGGLDLNIETPAYIFSLVGAFAFFAPLLAKWHQHKRLAWLALPAMTLFTIAFLINSCGLNGQWSSWRSRWPLLPMGIGIGLYVTYLIGNQERWLFLVATIITGYAIWVFSFFSAFKAGLLYTRPLLPAFLFFCGIALVILNVIKARQH
jgi:hypothetical protein